MALVRIEVRRGRSGAEKSALLESIHRALVEALRLPEDDRTQRLVEHDGESFDIPPGKSDRYTLVEITMFPGRSVEAKNGCSGGSSALWRSGASPHRTS